MSKTLQNCNKTGKGILIKQTEVIGHNYCTYTFSPFIHIKIITTQACADFVKDIFAGQRKGNGTANMGEKSSRGEVEGNECVVGFAGWLSRVLIYYRMLSKNRVTLKTS